MQNKWFKNLRSSENCKIRMFCFPHAGGSAEAFKHWGKYLPDWMELYSIQLPGRSNRLSEPLINDIKELVDKATNEIIPLLNSKSYIFLGHSLGGVIAFEVAKTLRRLNQKLPEHLFIVGRESPKIPEDVPMHNATNEDLIEYLRSESGTHEEVFNNKDLIQLLLPIIRADLKLTETYSKYYIVENQLSCPISVFWGTLETRLTEQKLEGWENETSNGFDIEQFEGHHFFLHEHPEKIIDKILQNRIQ